VTIPEEEHTSLAADLEVICLMEVENTIDSIEEAVVLMSSIAKQVVATTAVAAVVVIAPALVWVWEQAESSLPLKLVQPNASPW
jgi:hypothetical protein